MVEALSYRVCYASWTIVDGTDKEKRKKVGPCAALCVRRKVKLVVVHVSETPPAPDVMLHAFSCHVKRLIPSFKKETLDKNKLNQKRHLLLNESA